MNTWLTQKAMARILGTSQQNVSAHIRVIMSEKPEYEEYFVRKSRGRQRGRWRRYDLGQNYYHEFILEKLAQRIKTAQAQSISEYLKEYPLKGCLADIGHASGLIEMRKISS